MIDPHVHCRDGSQAYKETIAHVFEIADKQGVKQIFDMPLKKLFKMPACPCVRVIILAGELL